MACFRTSLLVLGVVAIQTLNDDHDDGYDDDRANDDKNDDENDDENDDDDDEENDNDDGEHDEGATETMTAKRRRVLCKPNPS